MIFVSLPLNAHQIRFLGEYHPYRIVNDRGERIKNPKWTPDCSRILDLKERQPHAIQHFVERLDPKLLKDIALAYVPSHDATRTESGVRDVARELAARGRIDATGCLVRHTTIQKLATGGDRGIEVHLNSMHVVDAELIRGRAVLLLDDVTTSGNSLHAGQKLLLDAGAQVVKMLALAKTVH
jgi:predicted amidophosphoribosyltransferase